MHLHKVGMMGNDTGTMNATLATSGTMNATLATSGTMNATLLLVER